MADPDEDEDDGDDDADEFDEGLTFNNVGKNFSIDDVQVEPTEEIFAQAESDSDDTEVYPLAIKGSATRDYRLGDTVYRVCRAAWHRGKRDLELNDANFPVTAWSGNRCHSTICAVCFAERKRANRERRGEDKRSKLIRDIRGRIKGTHILPGLSDVVQEGFQICSGPKGFARLVWNEYKSAKPGSAIRKDYLKMWLTLLDVVDKNELQGLEQLSEHDLVTLLRHEFQEAEPTKVIAGPTILEEAL